MVHRPEPAASRQLFSGELPAARTPEKRRDQRTPGLIRAWGRGQRASSRGTRFSSAASVIITLWRSLGLPSGPYCLCCTIIQKRNDAMAGTVSQREAGGACACADAAGVIWRAARAGRRRSDPPTRSRRRLSLDRPTKHYSGDPSRAASVRAWHRGRARPMHGDFAGLGSEGRHLLRLADEWWDSLEQSERSRGGCSCRSGAEPSGSGYYFPASDKGAPARAAMRPSACGCMSRGSFGIGLRVRCNSRVGHARPVDEAAPLHQIHFQLVGMSPNPRLRLGSEASRRMQPESARGNNAGGCTTDASLEPLLSVVAQRWA